VPKTRSDCRQAVVIAITEDLFATRSADNRRVSLRRHGTFVPSMSGRSDNKATGVVSVSARRDALVQPFQQGADKERKSARLWVGQRPGVYRDDGRDMNRLYAVTGFETCLSVPCSRCFTESDADLRPRPRRVPRVELQWEADTVRVNKGANDDRRMSSSCG
jgi:hypothetical protein